MNDKDLKQYTALVNFLGKALDKNTEVCLQNITGDNPGIATIVNGHISGRKTGAPLSEFAKERMALKDDNALYLLNYPTVAHDGKVLRSSTYFIRDNKNKLTGMICINTDVTNYLNLSEQLKQLAGISSEESEENDSSLDVFLTSAQDVVSENITNILIDMGINMPPSRLNTLEKQDVVEKLQEKGIFNLKGAVAEVANIMSVSEPTIYRYLAKKSK